LSFFLVSKRIFWNLDSGQDCIFWQTAKFFLLQDLLTHLPSEESSGSTSTQSFPISFLGLLSAQLVKLNSLLSFHSNLLLLFLNPIQIASTTLWVTNKNLLRNSYSWGVCMDTKFEV
jgi:hypothetical protein